MDDDFKELRKLLRLKRYEQPGPEYFVQFLEEFRQRQRVETLKRPLWQIALDRSRAWMEELSLVRVGYAFAGAAALMMLAYFGASHQSPQPKTEPIRIVKATPWKPPVVVDSTERVVNFPGNISLTDRPLDQVFDRAFDRVTDGRPPSQRYVLDARPVSYASPFSF